ncbi:tRNA dihydrouridine synthase DusB [Ferroacidibacillus organovorans]|uniref:tRNA-dihydrouridine synthase n=1 Tax=Ferroacidibacillus organovorans TaxID=1765683 RepID=A0A162UQG6_9BACL|nr:tRNA dihydrouridine synthase DusB [Ferroacidibacillus organovorans]KYP81958.1 nitrogen fixation protein NifR [Ferroacidibacillus organovorans]OAG94933.1 nitrogen fixation protein NifR [Ferroacidibacillus organovorans]OPG14988.1 tRNA dihydrouridine synthase DusB [Ferroacidibacillus organovorans]
MSALESLRKPLQIGNVTLDNPVILAPMAGVCNPPFRNLAKRLGAGMVCAEMVSDKALVHKNERTQHMLTIVPDEHPVSLQLVGYDIETMVMAAEMVGSATNADIIDINMGCPVLKIYKNGSGAALARDPNYAAKIVEAVVKRVNKPVTVKFRKGWDDEHVNAVEVAKAVEAAGARAVTVHGRTARQLYSGRADWSIIREVKEAVSIPVVGNGDVDSPDVALQMLQETGCDAVMVGRAALGYPWIFREIAHFLETGDKLAPPGVQERIAVAIEHLHLLVEDKGEHTGVREMRKHAGWYVKGIPGATALRDRVNLQETMAGMEETLLEILDTSRVIA